jgi:hypothetical protein
MGRFGKWEAGFATALARPFGAWGRRGRCTQACTRVARFDLGRLGAGLWPYSSLLKY